MTINISLSTESIANAISALEMAKENLEIGNSNLVEILANEGAFIAQSAYGGMANADSNLISENTAVISVTGETNLIAEFGAGDDTDPATGFENAPATPVYAGSYSELVGSGQYAEHGYWFFGGQMYTGVQPRHGLLNAKAFILSVVDDYAKELLRL